MLQTGPHAQGVQLKKPSVLAGGLKQRVRPLQRRPPRPAYQRLIGMNRAPTQIEDRLKLHPQLAVHENAVEQDGQKTELGSNEGQHVRQTMKGCCFYRTKITV
jgi:hypothetical protein